MKMILNNRLTLFVLIGCMLFTISACKKTENMNSATVELLSFGPSEIEHGEKVRFIGNNLDKVTAIEFAGATVPSSDFAEYTAGLIVVAVPTQARNGFVTLKTPGGDIVTKTRTVFDVTIEVSSFTETVKPGENITIEGLYMDWISRVTFGGNISVEQFESQSHTELVVKVPLTAKTGNLILRVGNKTVETEKPVTVILPAITGLSPNPAELLEEITISGTDLDLVAGLIFAGVTDAVTDFTVRSSGTELLVTVPEGALTGKVTLLTFSDERVQSTGNLSIRGALPALTSPVYTDGALASGIADWSSGTVTRDYANTENIREGASAARITYAAVGTNFAPHFNTAVDMTGSALVFSVYGGSGTGVTAISVLLAMDDGTYRTATITIEAGQWTDHRLSLADFSGSGSTLVSSIIFQAKTGTGDVWFDYVGLTGE